MDVVVAEKECECFGYIFFVMNVTFGISYGAADEHGGTVADVVGDDGFRKFRFAEVDESGVDGVAEIDAGVNESAVEIEDDEARCR